MKTRFPRAAALAVANELCEALMPHTTRSVVAGSLRRLTAEVGDVEILFVSQWANSTPHDLFAPPRLASRVDHRLLLMLAAGALVALAADAFGRAEEWLRSEAEAMRRNLHE